MKVIERRAAHYYVQEVECCKVYWWRPGNVVVECECGERVIFELLDLENDAGIDCECGADLTAGIREDPNAGLPPSEDERSHFPWHTSSLSC